MNEQEVIAIATKVYNNALWGEAQKDKLMRFARLITEKEREACANICEEKYYLAVADAIRARGQE